MPRPSSISPATREAILNGWALGKTAPQLADLYGTKARVVRLVITAARRRGDARAVMRNRGAAWRPEPTLYPSSRAFLAAALARVRERSEAWERTEMGRRMAAIAVPPPNQR